MSCVTKNGILWTNQIVITSICTADVGTLVFEILKIHQLGIKEMYVINRVRTKTLTSEIILQMWVIRSIAISTKCRTITRKLYNFGGSKNKILSVVLYHSVTEIYIYIYTYNILTVIHDEQNIFRMCVPLLYAIICQHIILYT